MAELGDLINSFEDFKINFKELVEELKILNAHLSDIKSALAQIGADIDDIKEILEQKWKDDYELNVQLINTIKDLVQKKMVGEEKKMEKKSTGKKKVVVARTGITSKQYNYIYHLVQELADLTKKSPEEIGKQLMKKYKKKLTEFSVDEASQLIEYLKKRIKEEKAKWMG
ncbi:MAG TPA: hypothetical protein ENG40_01220 [Thermoprotei archaeon]|nr:hypothetical protein [Thermoprotei archaeon]